MSRVTAQDLLEGPRGRRLCLELLLEAAHRMGDDDGWGAARHVHDAAFELEPGHGTSVLVLTAVSDGAEAEPPVSPHDERMRARPPAQRAAAALGTLLLPEAYDASTVRAALAASVDAARYWQEPDGLDLLAAQPPLRPALLRVAEVVARSGAATWWGDPLERFEQVRVAREEGTTPGMETVPSLLARWAEQRRADEARAQRERPREPSAPWSGDWWSTPSPALPSTTRVRPGGPFGLDIVEDSLGWERGEVREVSPAPGAVLELLGPADWAELCRRWPLDVQASCRHDWFRVTGQDRRWVMPDWSAVAGEYAAVHLTVLGYLRTAARLVELGDGRASVLAGWNPDETIWLRDGTREVGDPVLWSHSDRDGWTAQPG